MRKDAIDQLFRGEVFEAFRFDDAAVCETGLLEHAGVLVASGFDEGRDVQPRLRVGDEMVEDLEDRVEGFCLQVG